MSDLEQFASGHGRRILIVDDDEAVLKGLSEYFARLGYEVVRAATGQQGLDGFESQEPDVTILDLRLPDIDGMQILEIMRRKRALVILLTGYGDIPTAVRAMQLGAENFLTKPVDLPHLVATVEHAIEKLDLRRENVRLRQMVPSTRRKVMQVVAALVADRGRPAGRPIRGQRRHHASGAAGDRSSQVGGTTHRARARRPLKLPGLAQPRVVRGGAAALKRSGTLARIVSGTEKHRSCSASRTFLMTILVRHPVGRAEDPDQVREQSGVRSHPGFGPRLAFGRGHRPLIAVMDTIATLSR